MTDAVEFSRPQRLDQIGAGDSEVRIAADDAERAALAQRFGLVSLDRLEAKFSVRREGRSVFADGHVSGAVEQACIATGEPVPAAIEEDVRLRFVPAGSETEEELELDEDECDTVFYEGGAVDLGEAAAETLALALDPFPRSPDADRVLREAGVVSDEEADADAEQSSPLARALKEKLKGG
ncbi:YceD family protein [Stakelama marina]|uniref:DUF177 domain-containing protein n=1 Tax=Stakelama marina TaxID=2826939 RepID=A0A8T4ILZ1_9SPHN|nr:YceD family protein [Stakelama marina]MBR0553319.1 DUF177 domain-containing protein [Stakelama marina]